MSIYLKAIDLIVSSPFMMLLLEPFMEYEIPLLTKLNFLCGKQEDLWDTVNLV